MFAQHGRHAIYRRRRGLHAHDEERCEFSKVSVFDFSGRTPSEGVRRGDSTTDKILKKSRRIRERSRYWFRIWFINDDGCSCKRGHGDLLRNASIPRHVHSPKRGPKQPLAKRQRDLQRRRFTRTRHSRSARRVQHDRRRLVRLRLNRRTRVVHDRRSAT